ncbi:hypothetical protein BIFADO_01476 [Bifidobacterium adolescentis L2-32]|uniref:Uncharacterized protein n=1 Tax=Bifidobacterium adolescentis L2-32 TaxID=411481 RepID=A7A6J4_BIFAD|nr:hypothetical protein BIFADO_01476 [Bifidobacterium adolescentis L2-32]
MFFNFNLPFFPVIYFDLWEQCIRYHQVFQPSNNVYWF